MPGRRLFQYEFRKAVSVPFSRMTWYCSAVSCRRSFASEGTTISCGCIFSFIFFSLWAWLQKIEAIARPMATTRAARRDNRGVREDGWRIRCMVKEELDNSVDISLATRGGAKLISHKLIRERAEKWPCRLHGDRWFNAFFVRNS